MEIFIKGNLNMISKMDKVKWIGLIKIVMLDNGLIIKGMELVNLHVKMEISMMENGFKIKYKGKENS